MNNNLNPDHALLARIRAGDKSACAECIERHSPGLYRLALRMLGNEAEAEDILQETFLSAFEAIGSFDGRAALSTWLYRIGYNTALMRLRRREPETLSNAFALSQPASTWPLNRSARAPLPIPRPLRIPQTCLLITRPSDQLVTFSRLRHLNEVDGRCARKIFRTTGGFLP